MELEGWERIHPLHFKHEEYGDLQITQNGEWEQQHPTDGHRMLKAQTLREGLVEVQKPYKKPKIKKPKVVKAKKASKKLTIKKVPEVPKKKQVTKKTSKGKKKATVVKRKRNNG